MRYRINGWLLLIGAIKLMNYFLILLFLIKYEDVIFKVMAKRDSLPISIVDEQALGIRTIFSLVSTILAALSIWLLLWAIKVHQESKKLLILILVISIAELLFCGYRFLEFQHLESILRRCDDVTRQYSICYRAT